MEKFNLQGVKVSLVYPPYGAIKNEPGIKAVKENYGVFPSLSLLYVAGLPGAATGSRCNIIDVNAENLERWRRWSRSIQSFGPDFIAYNDHHLPLLPDPVLGEARSGSRSRSPSSWAACTWACIRKETMTHECLDYGVTGEAEVSLAQLLHTVLTRRGALSTSSRASSTAIRPRQRARARPAPRATVA